MRGFYQKQLTDIVNMFDEALDYIGKQKPIRSDITVQLLEELFDNTHYVIRFINENQGYDTHTEELLVRFCEMLFKTVEDETFGVSHIETLKKQMTNIQNTLQEEMKPDRIEITFFPYKADMWDCMESVYLAAKEDPFCDVNCVPIPWYKKNADGSFADMHYEADLFPDYVDITDYKNYDIAERNPDVVFIHNPYDDKNIVTSVHPNYYCSKLQEFTDCLVYIPYFVTGDDIEELYCFIPGTIHAHKTIVQSEKQRERYIKTLLKEYKKFGIEVNTSQISNKFVALGSPKFDRVFNTKRQDCTLPEKWQKLIEQVDGKQKKVIFYNTTVSTILKHNENFLKKLRAVLATFKNREDVVLWWRPHPLALNTIESMRSELTEEYREIVDTYQTEGWGIYDNSSDLHRAIAWSDAYYGDGSSIVTLYQATDKPMMLQNVNMINDTISDELSHSDAVLFGSKIIEIGEVKKEYPEYYEYASPNFTPGQRTYIAVTDFEYGISANWNVIYEIQNVKDTAKILKDFSTVEKSPFSYHAPVRIGNKLIFSPNQARRWAFYNIETKEWSFENLPNEYMPTLEYRMAFGGGIVFGDDIIFSPGESGAFAKYHIKKGTVEYFSDWYLDFKSLVKNVDYGILCSAMYYIDRLMFASPQAGLVLEFDPETLTVTKTYKIGNGEWGFRAAYILPNSDIMYLIMLREQGQQSWNEKIVKWNINTNEIIEFSDLPSRLSEESTLNGLNSFVFWKDTLYVTPLQGDSVLKIDLRNDNISKLILKPTYDFFERKCDYYSWAKSLAMPYIAFNPSKLRFNVQLPYDYSFVDVEFETGEVSNKRKYYFEKIKYLQMKSAKKGTNRWIDETSYATLNDYLGELASSNVLNSNAATTEDFFGEGKSGQKIYDYIKGCLEI